jgi:TPR repeat protein
MKKKSGHRRRTKVVRRSRKNLRHTTKRKRLGKGRRRPTRRYSRVQRGGMIGMSDQDRTSAELNNQMGDMYYNGNEHYKIDYTAAVTFYERAVKVGDTSAMRKLASMYEEGKGVDQDLIKAREYLEDAGERGDTIALRKLAFMYKKGKGVEKKNDLATNLYKLANQLESAASKSE